MKRVIKVGAEAEIYLTTFMDFEVVVKKRIPKAYRIPEVDLWIRTQRSKREVKIMTLAKRLGVRTPAVFFTDLENGIIVMEHVYGETLKKVLEDKRISEKIKLQIILEIGKYIGILHKNDIIHGDLTPSNIIVKDSEIILLDFGLSEITKDERLKATDLHVFKEALKTILDDYQKFFEWFTKGYLESYSGGRKVLEIEEEIEKMGRYVMG